jgi:hypothetical protein
VKIVFHRCTHRRSIVHATTARGNVVQSNPQPAGDVTPENDNQDGSKSTLISLVVAALSTAYGGSVVVERYGQVNKIVVSRCFDQRSRDGTEGPSAAYEIGVYLQLMPQNLEEEVSVVESLRNMETLRFSHPTPGSRHSAARTHVVQLTSRGLLGSPDNTMRSPALYLLHVANIVDILLSILVVLCESLL